MLKLASIFFFADECFMEESRKLALGGEHEIWSYKSIGIFTKVRDFNASSLHSAPPFYHIVSYQIL